SRRRRLRGRLPRRPSGWTRGRHSRRTKKTRELRPESVTNCFSDGPGHAVAVHRETNAHGRSAGARVHGRTDFDQVAFLGLLKLADEILCILYAPRVHG